MGLCALTSSTTGCNNIAIGQCSLYLNVTGTNNISIGTFAGCSNQTGCNNIFLGCNAQGVTNASNNTITLGNASIATIRAQVTTITALSDQRDKTNVEDIPLGLDFLMEIRPVKFTWNMRDGAKVGQQEGGFIAQELLALTEKYNVKDWMSLVLEENPERLEATPGKLLPIMVKAIQELAEKNTALEARLAALEAIINKP